jgi:hypothetical protein
VGSIAATHVSVQSLYDHEAAPVPFVQRYLTRRKSFQRKMTMILTHGHEHTHGHNHEHHSSKLCEASATGHWWTRSCARTRYAHSHAHSSNAPSPEIWRHSQMLQDAPSEWIPECGFVIRRLKHLPRWQRRKATHGAESMDAVHFMKSGGRFDCRYCWVHGSPAWASRLSVAAVSARRYRQTDHGILGSCSSYAQPRGHAGDTGTTWTHRRTGDTHGSCSPSGTHNERWNHANGWKSLFTLRRVGWCREPKTFTSTRIFYACYWVIR